MFRQALIFLKRHWPHAILIIPGTLIVTMIHESAHAAAVLLQGGTVTQFVCLPTHGKWGYVSYEFPAHTSYSPFLISIAPYLLWLLLAFATAVIAFRRPKVSYWSASLLYVWVFVIPVADIANTAFPYLAGKENDFLYAFGQPTILIGLMITSLAIVATIAGYYVQRRLYREDSLGIFPYVALSGVVSGGLAAITVYQFLPLSA